MTAGISWQKAKIPIYFKKVKDAETGTFLHLGGLPQAMLWVSS